MSMRGTPQSADTIAIAGIALMAALMIIVMIALLLQMSMSTAQHVVITNTEKAVGLRAEAPAETPAMTWNTSGI